MTEYTKMSDGCCHKTVLTRCEGCPYPSPAPDSIVGLEALKNALLDACDMVEADGPHGEVPSLRTRLIRRLIVENTKDEKTTLSQKLLTFCETQREHATPRERMYLEHIRKLVQEYS